MTKQQKYVPSNIDSFQPDAGMNSRVDKDNYYWFQVAEFGASLCDTNSRIHVDKQTGETLFYFDVDIMDGKGDKLIYADEQGHAKSLRNLCMSGVFSIELVQKLSDAIRKGGMSVRLTGRPSLQQGVSGTGEKYRDVYITDVYSVGNKVGNMMFTSFNKGQPLTFDSKKIADKLQNLVDFYYSKKTATA